MRLVCPNCDAEYEVDAALIPDTGRDVQCSNCGHAWFQPSPFAEVEAAREEALFAPAAGVETSAPAMPDDEDDFEPAMAAAPAPLAGGSATATRNIDSSVLNVLREEAEREARARAQEGQSLEVQGEMGLAGKAPGSGIDPGAGAAERIARLRGDAEVHSNAGPAAMAGGGAGAKSQMLPEIDAINSTLRAKSEKRSGDSAAVADTMGPDTGPSGGFRRGFLMAMTVIILALGLYLLAPMLIERFPALAGPLRAYVGYIEGLRGMIDRLLQALISRISGLMAAG